MMANGIPDYFEAALFKGQGRQPAGHAPDDPPPEILPDNLQKGFSGLAPVSWLVDKQNSLPSLMNLVRTRVSLRGIYLLGGRIMQQEWASAVPPAQRAAGFMIPAEKGPAEDHLRKALFGGGTSYPMRGAVFPGGVENNHHGAHETGPRKDDWTVSCPAGLSRNQVAEQCISIQEAIWGTMTLQKLESIKSTVDPQGLFNCYHCVGYQDVFDDTTAMIQESWEEEAEWTE
jgi:hypothetical protein